MNIIEFLQNNIIFVIGAVFFIFKMFGGSKTKKGNAMPTFGGGTDQSNRDQREHDYDEDEEDDYTRQQYEDENNLEQRRRAELQRLQEEETHRERQVQRADQLREEQKMRYEQQKRLQQVATTRQAQQGNQSVDYFAQNELGRESQAVDPFASREDKLKESVLTAGELRKALIWSEILRSPRAKRPYRR